MSSGLHSNRSLVHAYLADISQVHQSARALRRVFADDLVWQGCAPFDTQRGIESLLENVWQPLLGSFSRLQRRVDILIAGACEGEDWVASSGYIIGRFERDWLGIPATGREACFRYGEFHQIQRDRIVKSFVIFDLIELMQQAGCDPLPASLGLSGFVPPPRTGDGVLLDPQPRAESDKTFQLAHSMLFDGLNEYDQHDKHSMKQRHFWHDDMYWYGPAGIGTTRNLKEFEDWHQLPWLRAFPDRQVVWESPMFSEGHYAATAGWREVVATHSGEYLGHPATGKRIDCRVMDFWRREGDLLIENWVLIDLIDMFRQFGSDLMPGAGKSPA